MPMPVTFKTVVCTCVFKYLQCSNVWDTNFCTKVEILKVRIILKIGSF